MNARGARHKDRKKATCPRCHGTEVELVYPTTVTIKGIEKADAYCRGCSHRWFSENRAILALVR